MVGPFASVARAMDPDVFISGLVSLQHKFHQLVWQSPARIYPFPEGFYKLAELKLHSC
jgi:hypothetical protein